MRLNEAGVAVLVKDTERITFCLIDNPDGLLAMVRDVSQLAMLTLTAT